MKVYHRKKRRLMLFTWLFCIPLVILFTSFVISQAQTSPCPTETNNPRFPPDVTVYADIDVRFEPNVKTQIRTALERWTTANTNNGSGTEFNGLTPLNQIPTTAPLVHISFAEFTDDNGFPDFSTRASFDIIQNEGIYITEAVILFNTRALVNPVALSSGPFYNNQAAGYDTIFIKATEHEIGHGLGLDHPDPNGEQPRGSVMNQSEPCPNNAPNDACNHNPTDITPCDNAKVNDVYYEPPPPTPTVTPTPEPTATPSGGECEEYGAGWFPGNNGRTCVPPECADCYGNGGSYCSQTGDCWTPVVIDVNGNGFNLTNAPDGVMFAPDSSGQLLRTAWTAAHSDDAFLVLDRNGNGLIDDGTELFGSASPQPAPPAGQLRHGFLALALYDKPEHGGNNDNQIDAGDSVFAQLELWQDRNHNGVSEAHELQPLSASPVRVIELDYRESRRADEHGNRFKYRAKVRDARGAQVGRWAWDVFPVSAP